MSKNPQQIRALGPPKVLWISDIPGFEAWAAKQTEVSLSRPSLLLSAASLERLAEWGRKNPWATAIDLIPFYAGPGIETPPFFREFMRPEIGGGPWAVTSYRGPLTFRSAVGPARFDAVIATAREIASQARPLMNVWEIDATRTAGMLALGAALVQGKAVAVATEAGQGPPPMLMAACRKHGAILRVVQTMSGDGPHKSVMS